MLRSLHDYPDAASFIEAVKDLAMENQGFAGRAFLTWLTTDMRSKLETLQAARKEKEQLLLSSVMETGRKPFSVLPLDSL